MTNIPEVSKKLKQPLFIVDYNTKQLVSNQSVMLINGYDFSGRIFEDVIFKVKVSSDNSSLIVFAVSDYDYLKEQGESKWLKEALNSIIDSANRGPFIELEKTPGTFVLCNEASLQEHYPHLVSSTTKTKKP